jgi:hypothetical protein
MRPTYCKGDSTSKCRDFTDGSKVCLCEKGWNVFFATLNKHGWKDTSPRPSSISETVFLQAVEETVAILEIVEWYETKIKGNKECDSCGD